MFYFDFLRYDSTMAFRNLVDFDGTTDRWIFGWNTSSSGQIGYFNGTWRNFGTKFTNKIRTKQVAEGREACVSNILACKNTEKQKISAEFEIFWGLVLN